MSACAEAGLTPPLGVDLDEIHALGEIGQARRRLAGASSAGAIEHQLVPAAHHVGADERVAARAQRRATSSRSSCLPGCTARHWAPAAPGAGLGAARAWGSVEPDVLADVDASARPDVEHQRFAVSREIALLIEHRIVGQLALQCPARGPAQHRGGAYRRPWRAGRGPPARAARPARPDPAGQAVQHILLVWTNSGRSNRSSGGSRSGPARA